METASKDVLFTIALNLELPDLLRWCQSSNKFYQDVCNNDNVWRAKLLKDYPNYPSYPQLYSYLSSTLPYSNSPKETYVFLYQLSYIKILLESNETLEEMFLREEIDLSNKSLKKIPSFHLPNLQYLYLSNNELKEVPSFNLPNLKELYLSNNQLKEVPFFNLPNLKELNLASNELKEVPSFNLPNLQTLSLSNNQLKEVPLFNLPNLRELYLNYNQFKKLPFFNLPNLQVLSLYHNRLTKMSKKELKELYGNKIIM